MGWRAYFSSAGSDSRGCFRYFCWHHVVIHHYGPCDTLQQAAGTATVSFSLLCLFPFRIFRLTALFHLYSIIRILLMIPIYSLVAWLSIYYHKQAVYYSVMGDCYEAFTISAFFALMCHYLAPDLHSQKNYFRGIKPKQWVWPLNWAQKCCGGENGIWRVPRSGLTWFNVGLQPSKCVGWTGLTLIGHLGWRLPILCSAGAYDYRRGCHAAF